jgi:hypothetical protein
MNRRSGWFVVALLFLLAFAFLGLRSAPQEWPSATSTAQRIATIAEAGYGLFALLSAVALWMGHRSTMALAYVWAVLLTIAAGMAPVVWGGTGLGIGVAALAVIGAIAVGMVQIVQKALRGG